MYYHIRGRSDLQVAEPHVPYMALWGEPEIPRTCACSTIQDCILSLDGVDDLMMRFVYVIEDAPDVSNAELVQHYGIGSPRGEVFDADRTGEVWYTRPVRVSLIGQLGELLDELTIIL